MSLDQKFPNRFRIQPFQGKTLLYIKDNLKSCWTKDNPRITLKTIILYYLLLTSSVLFFLLKKTVQVLIKTVQAGFGEE